MKLLVTRTDFTSLSTEGELSVDGQPFGYTLEPPKRDTKPCAIPVGTYDVTIRWSPKHGRLIPHVENVPGFEDIEIHIGNFPKDTEGCLLVGQKPGTDFVSGSKVKFDQLFQAMTEAKAAGDPITITYVEQ
jgi:hypothetical protein